MPALVLDVNAVIPSHVRLDCMYGHVSSAMNGGTYMCILLAHIAAPAATNGLRVYCEHVTAAYELPRGTLTAGLTTCVTTLMPCWGSRSFFSTSMYTSIC